ncbi:MAG: peptidoglycan DD-metalloendopeptidase family protein [Xanthomonadales bacterium]|nr:peptidoglycan DD-metalloendopeptidase family protein [Xanthomonadales bacterium]
MLPWNLQLRQSGLVATVRVLRTSVTLVLIAIAAIVSGCQPAIDSAEYLEVDLWPSELTPPISGATFSMTASHLPGAPREYGDGVHQGFDFFNGSAGRPIAPDEAIVAVAAGEIIRVDQNAPDEEAKALQFWTTLSSEDGFLGEYALDRLRGRQVWIRHAEGHVSRYAHLSAVNPELSLGDTVKQGQIIGLMGNSGIPPTEDQPEPVPHLHFELWSPKGSAHLGEGLSPLETHRLVASLFGLEALPRYARNWVRRIETGQAPPDVYPPAELPEISFTADPPPRVTGGQAFAIPIQWKGDDFRPEHFFALLEGQPLGIIDASNGAWILGAMPFDIEAAALDLIVGATDPYGQTLVGNRSIERASPAELPAPREVSVEVFELYSDANLEREARSLGPVVGQSLEINEALWDESFIAPVNGNVVQHFGQRIVHSVLRPTRPLPGVEVEAEAGAPVVASNAGRVALIDDLPIRGTTVAIVHGGGVISVYGHLADTGVQIGDEVARGQRIGSVGQTGAVAGPMLRWEMHAGGIASNPRVWVDQVLPGRTDR